MVFAFCMIFNVYITDVGCLMDARFGYGVNDILLFPFGERLSVCLFIIYIKSKKIDIVLSSLAMLCQAMGGETASTRIASHSLTQLHITAVILDFDTRHVRANLMLQPMCEV